MKKPNSIRARLTVYGIGEVDKKQWNFFRKWIQRVADEMKREEKEVFNKKIFRATLYK